jgi:hypothetical protein
MKQILPIFLTLLVTSAILAQENDSIVVIKSPSARLSGLIDIQDLVNEGYNYWEEEFEGHWSGVELGIGGFLSCDYSMYSQEEKNFLDNDLLRSNALNINIIQYSKGIQRNRKTIGLVTGAGLSFQSYRLDNKTTITTDENRKVHPQTLFFESSQKSKLSSLYLEIPLLIEFQIPVSNLANHLYFSAGLIGSKRLETHTKIKYRIDGKREKLKSPGDYSIEDYRVSGTVRFGYRWINLFSTFDLVPFFEEFKGPKCYPFTVGVKLITFN